jgi:penicillin-binding protein 1C
MMRLTFAVALALWGMALGADRFRDWVRTTELPALAVELGAEVVARDGRLLRAYTVADGRWRLALDPTAVDPGYLAQLIAFEDRRFYQHKGVDPRALIRAAWQSAWNGRVVSGGSTLTMQVARLLENSGTGRWEGKVRQIRLALALEQRLSKHQILTLYLQIAPYGGNIEGLRAATLTWFGKEPQRLTPAEAALMVALPQAPETRRPDRAPGLAEAGRARVLSRATDAGVLSADAAAAALREAVPMKRIAFPTLAPHLADRLRAANPHLLRIETTLDFGLQRTAERLAQEALTQQPPEVQIAMMMADHRSGEILVSVGSAAYQADARQGFIDMTRALRSPGSTLKPFVYALAFDRGLAHPETLIEDRPTRFGGYAPQNFDRQFRGTLRLREALQLSLNIPVVLLTEALGPEHLVQALRRTGARAVLPGDSAPGLAVALGGLGISLRDLTQAYAALARGGVALPLRDQPGLNTSGERIFSVVSAWYASDILQGVTAPPGTPDLGLAYKTGTSYGHRDAWALGYNGRHVGGVWMGRADGSSIAGAFGADLAAPVLFRLFAATQPANSPLPPAPSAALLLPNSALPLPLQRFRPGGIHPSRESGPEITFPPDGAELTLDASTLPVRVRGGQAPYSWLVNGTPLAIGSHESELLLPVARPGPATLTVIDAGGVSARVQVTLGTYIH